MAPVTLGHDLRAQLTGQHVIERGHQGTAEGKQINHVVEAGLQKLLQKCRLGLTGRDRQIGDHPVKFSRNIPQRVRYAAFTGLRSLSLIAFTFSSLGAYLY